MCFALIGCGSAEDFLDKETAVKVVFNFEGGKYQNSTAPLVYYYAFKPGTANLIKNPAAEDEADKFNSSKVTREDHYFDGWFRTKIEVAEGVFEYENEWDFKKDRVTDEGVTLYAKWERLIHYTYGVYYINDAGEEVRLGNPYKVNEGDKFDDYLKHASRRPGYTAVGFVDADGNPWDPDFTHPGGEVSTEIKVYVLFERGEFVEVRTAAELVRNYSRDIRLMNDIDMSDLLTEEEKAAGKIAEFGGFFDYTKILDGNGYTISNFKLTYNQTRDDLIRYDDDLEDFTLGISLFGRTNGAEVRNVNFENVTVEVDANNDSIRHIILAPLCVKATNSKFTNVTLNATFTLTRLPKGFNQDNMIVVVDKGYHFKDAASTFENVKLTIDNQIAK